MRIIITSDNCLRYEGDDGTVAFVGDIADSEVIGAMAAIKAVFDGYKTPEQIAVDTAMGLALSTASESQLTELLPLVEQWEPDKNYRAGLHLHWDEAIYRVEKSHKSQADRQPDLEPASASGVMQMRMAVTEKLYERIIDYSAVRIAEELKEI